MNAALQLIEGTKQPAPQDGIWQLDRPCWTVAWKTPPAHEEEYGTPHHDSWRDARDAIQEALDDDPVLQAGSRARRAPGRCWAARCTSCGETLGTDDTDLIHYASVAELIADGENMEWAFGPDGDGPLCPSCDEEAGHPHADGKAAQDARTPGPLDIPLWDDQHPEWLRFLRTTAAG